MSASLIAKNVAAMRAYTPGEQPAGTDIVKLNTNENPYPPSPRVLAALQSFDPARLRRYPDPLALALRQRIAAMHGCAVEQVFAGNGSDEVLALATRAFVDDGGSIGYFEPSYSLYPVLADIRGVARRPVALGSDFAWRMTAEYRASLFFLANPNAPTSLRYDQACVAGFCAGFPGVVLIDEAYADFAAGNCMPLAVAPDNRNTLVARTLSKSFSLAGLRLGYVVGPAPLIAAIYKIKDSYNLDALTQTLALAALNDLDYMRANVARIVATRQRLTSRLRGRGWTVLDSQTNFLFARPGNGDARGCFERLRAAKIFVRYFPGPATGEYLRISVGTDQETDTLLRYLEEHAL
ncbi:MAG: histidinol-phosphate transaminase [Kiritimatiellae bacterium]|nr:histidinol-phosphate transaminase [Kiritimatiellia bacterium]